MAGQQRLVLTALAQLGEGLQVSPQVTIGLGDHGGVAAGESIAGDDAFHVGIVGAAVGVDKEGHTVGGVARAVDDLDGGGEPLEGDDLPVLQLVGCDAVLLVESANRRTGNLAETLSTVGVVSVAVGQQHNADLRTTLGGLGVQHIQVALVLRTRIHHNGYCVVFSPNHPGVRALKSSVAGVRRENDTDVRGYWT